jgi:alpha-1,3-fucosyltransferase
VNALNVSTYTSTKYILFWNEYFQIPFWGMKKETYDENDLKAMKCPTTNCVLTHQKNFKNVLDYHAIIFHNGNGEHWLNGGVPRARKSEQIYVMASQE